MSRSVARNKGHYVLNSSYDMIVLGAGAAGMTAAAVAARKGLNVLLIEKSNLVGGTTAVSGGMVWIPANSKMVSVGLSDSVAEARIYLTSIICGTASNDMLESFLKNADRCIRFLETNTAIRFRPVVRYPDYYPHLPGATMGGRVLEPMPFNAARLGAHFKSLRAPLPEFTLFGGMMVDRVDIPHFRNMARSARSAFRVARLLLRHGWERLAHTRGVSLVLGNALAARLLQSVLDAGVTLAMDTTVTELLISDRAVVGVKVKADDDVLEIHATCGVVLATGGFSHNQALRSRYLPAAATASAACGVNSGDGITLAQSAGAIVKEGINGNAFWVPVSRFQRPDGSRGIFPHTVTDRAKPGLIAVNHSGQRFINEACSYHAFVSEMLRANFGADTATAYLICDSKFIWKYGLGAIQPFTVSLRRYIEQGYLREAANLYDLALLLKIDPSGLETTVAHYNQGAAEGSDPDFGRGGDAYQRHLGDSDVAPNPCVLPINHPPYYAIAVHPGDLGTAAGLAVNQHGNLLDAAGESIRGLYACGNDMASVMEGSYPGPGITLGPALTFGFLIGERLAALHAPDDVPHSTKA